MYDKIKKLWHDPSIGFGFKMVAVYLCWKVFAHYTGHTDWWQRFTLMYGSIYARLTASFLSVLGLSATARGADIVMGGTYITVADHCLAIPATVIFAGSILLSPGRWSSKCWYIALGCAIIIVVNILRLAMVCYMWIHFNSLFFELNHSVIFVILFYSIVLWMVVHWMKKYAWA
jgi:exosortase/archaeosortase family protein